MEDKLEQTYKIAIISFLFSLLALSLQLLFTIAVIIMIINIFTTAELTLNMIAMLFVAVILIGIMFRGW